MIRPHMQLLEIHTAVWLTRLKAQYGETLTLDQVPDDEWTLFRHQGFDCIWLMGVWRRSPGARKKAINEPNLQRAFDNLHPGWTEADVMGSAYAIYDYEPDPFFGAPDVLKKVKKKLNGMGLKLVLDFVPNHLAFDHPWTETFPDRFIRPIANWSTDHPDWFYKNSKGDLLAHGRDPFFPPWNDTVQVNYFSSDLRKEFQKILLKIADEADGVRCDMAMLALNEVFRRVWSDCAGPGDHLPEFWSFCIPAVKQKNPQFLFLAEAYWDLEDTLLDLGFDYVYDKTLYDRLLAGDVSRIRTSLSSPVDRQAKRVRFIENHDEDRSIVRFGPEKAKAAAAVIATLPGVRFFYDGQEQGRTMHWPGQFRRESNEPEDPESISFYDRLLRFSNRKSLHEGRWEKITLRPLIGEDISTGAILSWQWKSRYSQDLVLINYSDKTARSFLSVDSEFSSGKKVFRNWFTEGEFPGKKALAASRDWLIELSPWQVLLLTDQIKDENPNPAKPVL